MTLQEYLTSLRHKTVAVIGIGVSNTPLLRRLLPNASRDEETLAAVSANVSANLLGLSLIHI